MSISRLEGSHLYMERIFQLKEKIFFKENEVGSVIWMMPTISGWFRSQTMPYNLIITNHWPHTKLTENIDKWIFSNNHHHHIHFYIRVLWQHHNFLYIHLQKWCEFVAIYHIEKIMLRIMIKKIMFINISSVTQLHMQCIWDYHALSVLHKRESISTRNQHSIKKINVHHEANVIPNLTDEQLSPGASFIYFVKLNKPVLSFRTWKIKYT